MNYYWVNIGASINEVVKNEFLWAPTHTFNEKGDRLEFPYWDNVKKVKKGDVIFCCANKKVSYIATAKSDAYSSERPTSRVFDEWNNEGNRIDVSLEKILKPVERDDISEQFMVRYDRFSEPKVFTVKGTLNQIYMATLSQEAAAYIFEMADLNALLEDCLISGAEDAGRMSATTRDALIKARIGQGKFRRDLISRWGECALTGVKNKDMLIASHIHAWSRCEDNKSRLDVDNGLLFAAHIDKLFDKGLISFSNDGLLLINSKLDAADASVLGIYNFKSLKNMPEGMAKYLEKHREYFGF